MSSEAKEEAKTGRWRTPSQRWEAVVQLPRKTMWFQPAVGGAVVGILGWFVPQTLGVGYSYVGKALNGGMALRLMLLL